MGSIPITTRNNINQSDDEKVCLTDYYTNIDTSYRFVSDRVSGKVQTGYTIEKIDGKYYITIVEFCQILQRSLLELSKKFYKDNQTIIDAAAIPKDYSVVDVVDNRFMYKSYNIKFIEQSDNFWFSKHDIEHIIETTISIDDLSDDE